MSASDRCRTLFTEQPWGAWTLVSLAVSVLSGLVLALQYDPAAPFYSVGVLELLAPFGRFWRSCHFYSSQLFFILSLVHLLAVVLAQSGQELRFDRWLLLIGSVPVALLLLFTGYVLRGDATGEAAGQIAEQITLAIPWLGESLNSLLFAIEAEGMKRVYANHLIGLGLVWGICCWDHLRRYRIGFARHGLLLAGLLLFPLLIAAPIEPTKLGAFHIPGPWFFLGLQELLRHFQPIWAGVLFPAILMLGLVLLHGNPARRRAAGILVSFWLACYLILSLVALWGPKNGGAQDIGTPLPETHQAESLIHHLKIQKTSLVTGIQEDRTLDNDQQFISD